MTGSYTYLDFRVFTQVSIDGSSKLPFVQTALVVPWPQEVVKQLVDTAAMKLAAQHPALFLREFASPFAILTFLGVY